MPVPKRTSFAPERTRAAVLASATGILYEPGLDGVGMAELCRHIGSKDGLVRAVLEEHSERAGQRLTDQAEAAGPHPHAQLSAVFDALAEWYRRPPQAAVADFTAPGFEGVAGVLVRGSRSPRPLSSRPARS